MEANLTEWYEREIKPVHHGVYEVRVKANGKIVRWFSYWNGTYWCMSSNTPGAAYVLRQTPSDAAEHAGGFEWRGITK